MDDVLRVLHLHAQIDDEAIRGKKGNFGGLLTGQNNTQDNSTMTFDIKNLQFHQMIQLYNDRNKYGPDGTLFTDFEHDRFEMQRMFLLKSFKEEYDQHAYEFPVSHISQFFCEKCRFLNIPPQSAFHRQSTQISKKQFTDDFKQKGFKRFDSPNQNFKKEKTMKGTEQ